MSTVKNINGNYTINSLNSGVVTYNTPLVTINGNLIVMGNTTSLASTTVSVFNANVVLNAGLSPANVSNPVGAYIINDRGSNSNVAIRWNETTATWQLTNNGSTYANIATSAAGGNINITGVTLYTDSTRGTVQVFANTAGSGGSGVYVTNTQTTGAELVTKAKAVAYSIVFG